MITKLNDIEGDLLIFLYVEYFTKNGFTPLTDFEASNPTLDKKLVEEAFLQLKNLTLIKMRGMGPQLEITVTGILVLEGARGAPEELYNRQREVRKKILEALEEDRKPAELQELRYETIVSTTSISQIEFDANIKVLSYLGYVEGESVGSYSISRSGTEILKEWDRLGLDDLDVALKALEPGLVELRKAANIGAISNEPETVRAAAHNARELLRQTLSFLAPDDEIKSQAGFQPSPKSESGITRKMRVGYAMKKRKGNLSESDVRIIEALEDVVDAIYYRLSAEAHRDIREEHSDVTDLIGSCEIALRRLLL